MCSKSDKVELDNPYEKSVIDELNKYGEELTHFGLDTRLCSHEKLKDSENYLLCKECVIDKIEEEVISQHLIHTLKKNATKNQSRIIRDLLKGFRRHQKKSAARNIKQLIKDSSVKMIDKTIGIASENTYRCSSKCHSSIPLTQARNDKSYAKKKGLEL